MVWLLVPAGALLLVAQALSEMAKTRRSSGLATFAALLYTAGFVVLAVFIFSML